MIATPNLERTRRIGVRTAGREHKGILDSVVVAAVVFQSGIKGSPKTEEVWSPNHWTAR